ncbi:hypothetical protein K1T71_015176 [Dendrolimus kikuchii]|nr:hypothetical protein K1T71_015176 [Dendrolimus kikuchii]
MFDTTEDHEGHMTAKHKSGPTYPRKCSYCDKVFNQSGLFFRHQAKKHSDKPSEYSNTPKLCEVCGATVFLMANHMRLHMQDMITFKCEYCNPVKQFSHPTLLARHVLAKHTPYPHICSICDRGYNGRQECLDHILKLHAPEKPFTYEFCSRSFSHMDYLRDHARNSHKVIIKRVSEYSSKMKSNLVVYPHSKLNLSLLKPNLLTSLRIKLSNYDNTKMVTLEKSKFEDYLILDKGNEILDGSVPKKRKTKWDMKDLDCDEKVAKKRRVVKKGDDIITTTKIIQPMVKKVMVKQNKIKEEVIHDNSEVLDDNDSLTNDNSEIVDDNNELVHDDFGLIDDSGVVINEDSSGNLVINEPLQVYEENNEQFVYINGVVYKVETED